jgi:hypothetical protein
MISQISITLPLTASAWPTVSARVEGFPRLAVNVTKRNCHRAQGCFPMTD